MEEVLSTILKDLGILRASQRFWTRVHFVIDYEGRLANRPEVRGEKSHRVCRVFPFFSCIPCHWSLPTNRSSVSHSPPYIDARTIELHCNRFRVHLAIRTQKEASASSFSVFDRIPLIDLRGIAHTNIRFSRRFIDPRQWFCWKLRI